MKYNFWVEMETLGSSSNSYETIRTSLSAVVDGAFAGTGVNSRATSHCVGYLVLWPRMPCTGNWNHGRTTPILSPKLPLKRDTPSNGGRELSPLLLQIGFQSTGGNDY